MTSMSSNSCAFPEGHWIFSKSTDSAASSPKWTRAGLWERKLLTGYSWRDSVFLPSLQRDPGADAERVALLAPQGNLQITLLGEVVFVQEQRASSRLPNQHIGHSIIVEVGADAGPTISLAVHAALVSQIQKDFSVHTQISAVGFKGTQIESRIVETPGIANPEFP